MYFFCSFFFSLSMSRPFSSSIHLAGTYSFHYDCLLASFSTVDLISLKVELSSSSLFTRNFPVNWRINKTLQCLVKEVVFVLLLLFFVHAHQLVFVGTDQDHKMNLLPSFPYIVLYIWMEFNQNLKTSRTVGASPRAPVNVVHSLSG